jgi:hypothetical protein
MRKLIAVAVLFAGAVLLWPRTVAQAGSPCTVPKSWGRAVAMAEAAMGATLVAFEAEDGTVRVTPGNCKPGAAVHTIGRTAD